MENTIVEESGTVAEKIVSLPVQAGTVVVKGTETVLGDGALVALKVGEVVVDATKTAAVDIVEGSQAAGREVAHPIAPGAPAMKPATTDGGAETPT